MEINDGKDIFQNQKKYLKEKAETIAKHTYAVIERCCNKKIIRKTFWKGVALPSSFMRKQVANLNMTQVNEIQTIENGLYKKKKSLEQQMALYWKQ